MPFEVTATTKLQLRSDLVFAIISSPHRLNTSWTAPTLRVELGRIGLTFTSQEMNAIATELITRGVLVTT